jgi:hypothetical protein
MLAPTRINFNLTDEPGDGSVARTPSKRAPGPASKVERSEVERDTFQATQKKRKRVKAPQVTKSVEEAKAANLPRERHASATGPVGHLAS